MRITTVGIAAALALMTVATALRAERPEEHVDARALALLAQARSAKAAGQYDVAENALETSLAVDPANREAFVLLGEIAQARGLPGKAIGFYREALVLDPNDVHALSEQGAALVARGAVTKAQANLARIKTLCHKQPCAEETTLAASIAKGPPVTTALSQQAVTTKPATAKD